MLNFCKKEIEFLPTLEGIKDIAPIIPAKKFLPQWFKQLDANKNVQIVNHTPIIRGTIKKCPGVVDFLRTGYIVPCWTDIFFDYETQNYEITSSLQQFIIFEQVPAGFVNNLSENIKNKKPRSFKLLSPWLIKTPPGYSTLIINPFFHFNEDFECIPGVLDTDIFHTLSIEIFVKESKTFAIPFYNPMCILIPFKRKKINYKINNDKKTIEKLSLKSNLISFTKFSSSAMYNLIRKTKCPFNNK